MTQMELIRQALGVKPQATVLRKALEFEDASAGFFEPIGDVERVGQPETVAAFSAALKRCSWQDTVLIIPIGVPDALLQELVHGLGCFVDPVKVELKSVPMFQDVARLKMFCDRSTGVLDQGQIMSALERYVDREAVVACVVSDELFAQVDGLFVGFDGTNPRKMFQQVTRNALFHWAKFQPCVFFRCPMNPQEILREQAPHVLCPVCLRKLSLAMGGGSEFDVKRRYLRLLGFYTTMSFDKETQWIAERLAHLGDTRYVSTILCTGEEGEQDETTKNTMQRSLKTLKSKLTKRKTTGPVFG